VCQTLVVSIAAGIRTADLSRWLGGHDRIVRVMPNTPALIRQGLSAAFPLAGSARTDAPPSTTCSAPSARCSGWTDEDALDGVTALSGSGPPTSST
jgi:pyrroline-5-carboxylate reductase